MRQLTWSACLIKAADARHTLGTGDTCRSLHPMDGAKCSCCLNFQEACPYLRQDDVQPDVQAIAYYSQHVLWR